MGAGLCEYTQRYSVPAGDTATVLTFRVGDMSSLLIRSELSDFQVFPYGYDSGVELKSGECISRNYQDYERIDSNLMVRYCVRNTGSVTGTISVWFTGTF